MKKRTILVVFLIGLMEFFSCYNTKNKSGVKKDSTKTQSINSKDLLFTTPTLENALPDFENKMDTTNLQFNEDDWRQIEFIAKTQKVFIDQEMSKIKDIYDNYSQKIDTLTAFKKVAVRELIKQPLIVDFSKLKSYLMDGDNPIKGISLYNNPGQVRNGFSFTANGINYYGILDDKNVKTFCIYSADSKQGLKASFTKLSKFLKDENLYIVDWRRMKVIDENNIEGEF